MKRPSYGNPVCGDGLGNMEVGKLAGRQVSYRFRAKQTGTVTGVRIYVKTGSGYSLGTGGSIKCDLRDNTTGDVPVTSPNLATVTIADPATGSIWRTLTFDSSATVTKGELYHLVFTNPDATPTTNYVSINGTAFTLGGSNPRQPMWSDDDMAVLIYDTSTAGRYWTVMGRRSPIFGLVYNDASQKGNGVINIASSSLLTNIGGGNEIRQPFTPTGNKGPFRDVCIWMYKNGAAVPTQDCEVYIRDSSFNILHTARIAPSHVSPDADYARARFANNFTLTGSTLYYLHLRAYYANSTDYKIFPTESGTSQGFATEWLFDDGIAQYTTDRGVTWNNRSGSVHRWIFYFPTI
jgi:hypothetical protein